MFKQTLISFSIIFSASMALASGKAMAAPTHLAAFGKHIYRMTGSVNPAAADQSVTNGDNSGMDNGDNGMSSDDDNSMSNDDNDTDNISTDDDTSTGDSSY